MIHFKSYFTLNYKFALFSFFFWPITSIYIEIEHRYTIKIIQFKFNRNYFIRFTKVFNKILCDDDRRQVMTIAPIQHT